MPARQMSILTKKKGGSGETKLKEEWETIYQVEKANREELEKELKDAWKKMIPFSFFGLGKWLCAWDEAHPAFIYSSHCHFKNVGKGVARIRVIAGGVGRGGYTARQNKSKEEKKAMKKANMELIVADGFAGVAKNPCGTYEAASKAYQRAQRTFCLMRDARWRWVQAKMRLPIALIAQLTEGEKTMKRKEKAERRFGEEHAAAELGYVRAHRQRRRRQKGKDGQEKRRQKILAEYEAASKAYDRAAIRASKGQRTDGGRHRKQSEMERIGIQPGKHGRRC